MALALRTRMSTVSRSAACVQAPKPSMRPIVSVRGRTLIARAAEAPPPANPEVLEKVRVVIAEQLGADLDKVAAESTFSDLGADSLDTVEIMMKLEEIFDITLSEDGAEKIATVGDAAAVIGAQVAGKAPAAK